MQINELINEIKEKTKDLEEIEIVRYVYLKLGSMFYFDSNFSFGNSKTRYNIYKSCSPSIEKLNEYLEKRTIICRSLSYILRYILKELGIKNEMGYEDPEKRIKHTYNIVKLSNNETIYLDLEEDLERIQFKCRTKLFISDLTKNELEQIDKKIGYISDQEYYYDEYLDLIKYNLSYFSTTEDKVSFILQNLDYYKLTKGYIEFHRFYSQCLINLLKEESRKIHLINGYINNDKESQNFLCIAVYLPDNDIHYYFVSPNSKEIKLLTKEELSKQIVTSNINFRGSIPGLKLNKGTKN